MGLLNKIFGRPAKAATQGTYFTTLNGYSPVYTSWNGKIYESMQVRAAIHARATHISKLEVRILGSAKPTLQTRLRQAPNEWQCWSQFLYQLSTILDVENTAFIVPVQDYYGSTTGICSILPSLCHVVEYGGETWLRYQFRSGQFAAVEFKRCGIMTKFQCKDPFFGENNNALTPTMELINIQSQGISEAVKSSGTFRFMAKVSNFSNDEDLAKERKRFTRENMQNSDGGLLLFPNTFTDIQQIKSTPFVVDTDQMKAIDQSVNNYFGVNEAILQNKATGDEWCAFDDGVTEPFAIQFDDVVSRMLFTELERSHGSRVSSTVNQLQYMTFQEKREFATQMADRGALNRDEIREIFGKPPLPDGQGKAYTIRGEYYLLNADGSVTRKGDDITSGTKSE